MKLTLIFICWWSSKTSQSNPELAGCDNGIWCNININKCINLSCVNFDQIISLSLSGHREKKITGMTEAMCFSRETNTPTMLYAAYPEKWSFHPGRVRWGTRPPLSEFSGSALIYWISYPSCDKNGFSVLIIVRNRPTNSHILKVTTVISYQTQANIMKTMSHNQPPSTSLKTFKF